MLVNPYSSRIVRVASCLRGGIFEVNPIVLFLVVVLKVLKSKEILYMNFWGNGVFH